MTLRVSKPFDGVNRESLLRVLIIGSFCHLVCLNLSNFCTFNLINQETTMSIQKNHITSPTATLEPQPVEESFSPFNGMPNELLDLIALHTHSDKDIGSASLASKAIHDAPTSTVIRNIRRFCHVEGDRI